MSGVSASRSGAQLFFHASHLLLQLVGIAGANIGLDHQADSGSHSSHCIGGLFNHSEHLVPFTLNCGVGGRCSSAAARNPSQDEPLLDAGKGVGAYADYLAAALQAATNVTPM